MKSSVMKCFCIGLTKTGTTSFNRFMRSLGLKTQGFSRKLLEEYLTLGEIGPKIARAIDENDAFDDWPWPFLYEPLAQKFGNDAVFVLTRRSSPEKWLQSIKRYSLNSRTHRIRAQTYGTQFPHGFEEHYLHRYNSHLEEVRSFFASHKMNSSLIEGDIADQSLFPEIACSLDLQMVPEAPKKVNRTNHRLDVATENLAIINKTLLGLGKKKISLEEAGFISSKKKQN